eukprot:gene19014-biopygen23456
MSSTDETAVLSECECRAVLSCCRVMLPKCRHCRAIKLALRRFSDAWHSQGHLQPPHFGWIHPLGGTTLWEDPPFGRIHPLGGSTLWEELPFGRIHPLGGSTLWEDPHLLAPRRCRRHRMSWSGGTRCSPTSQRATL